MDAGQRPVRRLLAHASTRSPPGARMDDDGQARRVAAHRARRIGATPAQEPNAMKHITFHFDFISPYAYLAFERLPQALEGLSYSVRYRPVLFAGAAASTGARRARPRSRPSAPGPTATCCGWRIAHGIADARCRRTHPVQPAARCCAWRWPARPTAARQPPRRARPIFRHVWRAAATPATPRAWRRWRSALAPRARPGRRRGQGAAARPTPTRPSRAACSACRRSRSTAACSGASTALDDAARLPARRRLVRRPAMGRRRPAPPACSATAASKSLDA